MSQILDKKLEKMSKEERDLWALRHTAEHVLHTAMQNLYPKLKKAMGPATPEGYYHDFDCDQKISEDDFPKIEKEMQRLIDANLPMIQQNISPEQARIIFKNNPYKLEWIKEIEKREEKVSVYKMSEEEIDLCSGPHVKSTGEVKAFKLLSVAGAYWHGDEKNKMLTRIYGTAFPTKEELDVYLENQKTMEERDHRKLGKDLDLFVFSELVGKGLPLLTPKGAVIRRELERFIVDEEIKRGYDHVYTPSLAKTELYKVSGHYPYYKDTMYPAMKVDEEELILRPMTCPHHFMLYKSKLRSYKELPVRFAEISPQFRYEKSGELTGLTRVRTFCLADAHIMCTKSQAKEEIKKVLELIEFANGALGFVKGKDYRYRLSLGDRKDDKKYYKDNKAWDYAENVLREVLKETKAPFFEAEGEAAFYGPKIDIQMKRISGQEETAFTVQYDFVMPKRFKLEYINEKGQIEEPIVVHRSSIGAFERTMSFIIEHTGGAFPVWLAPVQVQIIPISEKHLSYAQKVNETLLLQSIRVKVDDRNETMQEKIRLAQTQKIPYMLIVGDKEEKDQKVALRTRDKGNVGQMKLDEFLKKINEDIENKV
ncbi:MAG: threonine--tRNA ligase [Candidatus Gottesmanbacteria bacterium]